MTKELRVKSDSADYPIYIGAGILKDLATYLDSLPERRVVVSDKHTAELYLDKVCKYGKVLEQDTIVIPSGESSKSLDMCEVVYRALLEKGITRDSLLLALGGGVVGDLTGFVAATYLRGVDYVQLPTTLLAQVDSSVGGKTAVNHELGKNLIGAFHHPRVVVSDTETLKTLPQRERISALAEIIKCGLIADETFFEWLEDNIDALRDGDEDALAHAICESCRIKAEIVSVDEFERSGERALLNLGHTFGHALESCLGYGEWLHGEAVACGIVISTQFSLYKGLIDNATAQRAEELIKRAGLPNTAPPSMSTDCMIKKMLRDKKNMQTKHRLILLTGIGQAMIDHEWSLHAIETTLAKQLIR